MRIGMPSELAGGGTPAVRGPGVTQRPESESPTPQLNRLPGHALPESEPSGEVRQHKLFGTEATRNDLDQVVGTLNHLASEMDTDLLFKVDQTTGRVLVRVVDVVTGDTVREIPPHEIVEAFSRLQEVVGLLFDRKM